MPNPAGMKDIYITNDSSGAGGGSGTGGQNNGNEGGLDIGGGTGEGSGTDTGTGTGTETGTGSGGGNGGSVETQVDIFDRVISVPSIVADYTDEELNREYHSKTEYEQAIEKYGAIFKVLNFSDVDDVNLLQRYAKEWIRRNYYDGVLSFTVKAIDLHLLGYDTDKIKCGDYLPIEFLDLYKTPVTKYLTCMSVQYDLFHPENDTYKIGIPDVSADIKYRESLSSASSYKNANSDLNSPSGTKTFFEKANDMFDSIWRNAMNAMGLDIGNPEERDKNVTATSN